MNFLLFLRTTGNSYECDITLKDSCNPKNQIGFNFEVDRISYKDINFVKIIGKGNLSQMV